MKRAAIALAGLALAAIACSSSTPPDAQLTCVADVSATCSPSYAPPTYDIIFAKILQPNCATGTGTCHTADAREGGLAFVSADESYSLLLGKNGAPARVVAGDASCSQIMERLGSHDASLHMPPGPISLSAPDQCTIQKWIAAGAAR